MSNRVVVVIVAVAVLVAVVVSTWVFLTQRSARPLVLATGQPGGTYVPLGEGLRQAGLDTKPRLAIELRETSGAVENMDLVESGAADIGFVQNDTVGSHEVRAIAPLYREVLHILVRRDANISSPRDMRGRRVAVGPEQSGTRAIVERLISHYGMSLGDMDAVPYGGREAADKISSGEIEAWFYLTGMKSAACQHAIDSGQVELLSLGSAGSDAGEMQGFRISYPYAEPYVIPILTYASDGEGGGEPQRPIATLGIRAVLVANRDVSDDVAYALTQALFEQRADLSRKVAIASDINEQFDSAQLQFPLHPGANAYYRRDDPAFLVTYAEPMALLLSAIVALTGFGIGLQKWLHRRKKNRVDLYYVRLNRIFAVVTSDEEITDEQLAGCRRELAAMRRDAFQQLIDEELLADESFRIFQDYWSECWDNIEALRRKRGQTDSDSA